MHTFDDWELRALLEDTLARAHLEYRHCRASDGKRRGLEGKTGDWHYAARLAVDIAMDALWFESTRPAAAQKEG